MPTVHATCIAIDGRGVLLSGPSGSGKSDLAFRLIDRGAALVSDDYSMLEPRDGRLWASAPPGIAGRIEVRGVGILPLSALAEARVALLIDLAAEPERLPERATREIAGIDVPAAAVRPFEASAPLKVEALLKALAP